MWPDPLHPAVVHLPIALAVIMPALAALGALVIFRRRLPVRAWGAIVLLQVVLVGSAWLAIETGEGQEERVERVVAERHIEHHEEAAERFVWLAALALLPISAGLLTGRAGHASRVAGTAAAFGVLMAGAYAGHSGGELVYSHGAAAAYTTSTEMPSTMAQGATSRHVHGEDEEDDD